jgi:hypothetical protein
VATGVAERRADHGDGLAPNGNVYFVGPFFGPISFGGPTIEPNHHVDFDDTYLAALSPTGDHLYSHNLVQRAVYSVASTGSTTAVSTDDRALVFGSDGQEIFGQFAQNPVRASGTPAQIAVGSGRVYWNFEASPLSGSPAYPYLGAFQIGV